MLQPLDERKLNALVPDGGSAGCGHIERAREFLEENKNLPDGLLCLLGAWEVFNPRLHWYLEEWDKGNEKWHLYFYNPPFRGLRLHPVGGEGVIEIHASKKPLVSFRIFDDPRNWRAMLKWIWEYGDERQIARSIPQLNSQRLSALLRGSESDDGDELMAHHLMRNGCKFLEDKCISEGVMHLLMAFGFAPRLSIDKSSPSCEETGYERWHITFAYFPFDNLRILPKTSEGIIDVYVSKSKKPPKSFTLIEGPASWQAFLEWIWEHGNNRHIARIDREVLQRRAKPKSNPAKRPRRAGTPLLYQALRTAGLKAHVEMSLRTGDMDVISNEAGNNTENVDGEASSQRRPLQVANPNRPMGGPTTRMNDSSSNRKGYFALQVAGIGASGVENKDLEASVSEKNFDSP